MKILEMAKAIFWGADGPTGDELFLDAKPGANDCVKLRAGTHDKGQSFLWIQGDVLDGDRRLCRVSVAFKPDDDQDQRGAIERGLPGGCLEIRAQKADTQDDAGDLLVLRATSRYVEVFGQRIEGLNPLNVHRLYSPNGRYFLNMQNDGNLVKYDTHGSPDPSQWTGKLIG